jgi:hypothetical protein
MHLPLTRDACVANSHLTGKGDDVQMRNLLIRSMGWLLIAATALMLLGLAQVPELWAGAP